MSRKYWSYCKLILLFFNIQSIFAQIIETDNIASAIEYTNGYDPKDILFIFDLDFTVILPRIKSFNGDPKTKEMLLQSGHHLVGTPLYEILQKNLEFERIEYRTADFINKLQLRGYPVIALTARSILLLQRTIEQLDELSINFSTHGVLGVELGGILVEKWLYHEGIIFAQDNDKGEVLNNLLGITRAMPKKIIFIDDQLRYLKQVEAAIGNQLDFIGIKYSCPVKLDLAGNSK